MIGAFPRSGHGGVGVRSGGVAWPETGRAGVIRFIGSNMLRGAGGVFYCDVECL
jgi:hypothetical protein